MTESASPNTIVGRVLRASTRGFDCGTHSSEINDSHNFGAFVRASIANNPTVDVVGLIYKVEIKDDQLVTELVMGEYVPESILRDQRENRMVPVEIKVLNIGYLQQGQVVHSLPPRPPMSLSDVSLCTVDEIYAFTQYHSYFRMVLGAAEVPSDDLLGASIRAAASIYQHEADRYTFLASAGRQLARELAGDLRRLSHILALIQP